MRISENKAKELLERILNDISKKYEVSLVIDSRSKNFELRNGRLVDSMFISEICEHEDGCALLPLLYVTGRVSHVKLLNKLVKDGLAKPHIIPYERIDIIKTYGSTYEQMMMNLDMNEVE